MSHIGRVNLLEFYLVVRREHKKLRSDQAVSMNPVYHLNMVG
jgi:hypothetical protein